MHCRHWHRLRRAASKGSFRFSTLACLQLAPHLPPPTPTHVPAADALSTLVAVQRAARKCFVDCSTLAWLRDAPRLPPSDTDTRGSSRCTVDTGVGVKSCVLVLCRLQHSLHCCRVALALPPPDTDTCGSSRCTVETLASGRGALSTDSIDCSTLACLRGASRQLPPTPTHVAAADALPTLTSIEKAASKCSVYFSALSTGVGSHHRHQHRLQHMRSQPMHCGQWRRRGGLRASCSSV